MGEEIEEEEERRKRRKRRGGRGGKGEEEIVDEEIVGVYRVLRMVYRAGYVDKKLFNGLNRSFVFMNRWMDGPSNGSRRILSSPPLPPLLPSSPLPSYTYNYNL